MNHIPKKTLYLTIAITSILVCIFAFVFLLIINTNSLELSTKDGETITLEYGIDSVPAVTALYWDSIFDKKGTSVPVTMDGDLDTSKIGSYTVTYHAAHEDQKISATQIIVIQDTTAPTIELIGGDVGYYSPGYTYTESGYTATDNFDGDLTESVVRTEKGGTITYSVTDSFGNSTTITRKIECKDVVAPAFTFVGEEKMVINHGSSFKDPGVMAVDDVDGDITANITVEGTIDTTLLGEQYLTYSVSDSSGNLGQIKRTVIVQELIPPELTLTDGDSFFLKLGDTFTDPGFTAIDNADGDISDKVVVSGNVDNSTIGSYILTYTSTDSSNNTSSLTRTVYVYAPQGDEFSVEPNGRIVYLSFDDGPGPYTQQLLDILDKYNVKVTFFVTSQYKDYQDLIGEAHRRGHTIAMHTYSHVFSDIYSSETAYYNDLSKIREICIAQTGEAPTIVRFPGGTSNVISKNYCRGIMSALTQSLTYNGFQYCDWNIDSKDAGGATDAATVAYNVISELPKFKNSFVLQHDTKLYSVEAVEQIICWGLANGYTFMPMEPTTPMFHHSTNN